MTKIKRLPRIGPAFLKGFDDSCRLLALDPESFNSPTCGERGPTLQSTRTVRLIKELHNRITPGAKAAAIKRNRELAASVLRLIRVRGSPTNKSQFIRELREMGALDGIYADGRPYTLDERTVSRFLRDRFGIVGKPGRKAS